MAPILLLVVEDLKNCRDECFDVFTVSKIASAVQMINISKNWTKKNPSKTPAKSLDKVDYKWEQFMRLKHQKFDISSCLSFHVICSPALLLTAQTFWFLTQTK